MKSELWWYVARSGGIVAWTLCAASVLWGLLLCGDRPTPGGSTRRELNRRAAVAKLRDMHRFLSGLAIVFVAVHGVGLLLDDTLGLSAVDVLVPWASDVDPTGLAWGVVAFYLLLAVEITSLLRTRVPEAIWRATHVLGLVVFLLGTVHGLDVGTDVDNPLIWWPAAAACAAILGLAAYRILSGDLVAALSEPSRARVTPQSSNVTAALLERTLSELARLDTSAYPVATPTASDAPAPTVAPLPPPPPPPAPVAAQPAAPEAEPTFARFDPGAGSDESHDAPRQPPVPSRAPAADTPRSPLPTRVPQRLAATTAPAATLGAWMPAASSAPKASGPPPPPANAVDPETGEPDPQAYRKWLRDWLEYVESQP